MTLCAKGQHEFPIEDESGAYCPDHGVTLLWHGPPITEDDLLSDDSPSRPVRPVLAPAPLPHPH
ncbi:hypothetical protein [Streptomyces lushanensis]|uniref:hypothetical protein n=1 Tax=Streptomyces lushanensis TaxID=1434255 RepID=UPI00082B9783|nr:hypothetical protein [Streptomyces lushanensis]